MKLLLKYCKFKSLKHWDEFDEIGRNMLWSQELPKGLKACMVEELLRIALISRIVSNNGLINVSLLDMIMVFVQF